MIRKVFIGLLVILFVVFIGDSINKINSLRNLRTKGKITNCKIYEVFDAFRSKVGFKYYFFIDGQKKFGKDFYDISLNIKDSFEQRLMPVIYLPTDPLNNRLLITRTVFNSMGINFPDSLQWIEKFYTD